MLRHSVRSARMLPPLRGVLTMMRDRLHLLAVFRYALGDELVVPEIVADAIARENFRRHQSRANIPAVIAQDEFIQTRFPGGRPIFLRRDENRFAGGSHRPSKNKRMDPLAIGDFHIRHLSGLLFHDDGGEGAAGKREREQ